MSMLVPYKDINPTLNELSSIYYGVVEDNNDPLRLQRIKVRIKELFGSIKTSDLPWCIKDNCAGNSNSSGMIGVPSIGQTVIISFDCGDIYSPKYSTGYITQAPQGFSTSDYGFCDSSGNYIKLNPDGVTINNLHGNSITMSSTLTKITSPELEVTSTDTTIGGNVTANGIVTANSVIPLDGYSGSVTADGKTLTFVSGILISVS